MPHRRLMPGRNTRSRRSAHHETIRISEESTIFGPTTAPEEQVCASILAQPTGTYTAHDVTTTIVPTYYHFCQNLDINPVIAIAQMIHETANLTSWWAGRPRRNPAGIGVNGRRQKETPPDRVGWADDAALGQWVCGVSFDSGQDDAVPAHVGRLFAWFMKPAARSVAQRHTADLALAYRPLAAIHQGSATMLRHLGATLNPSGAGWASPGTTYDRSIAARALRMSRGR